MSTIRNIFGVLALLVILPIPLSSQTEQVYVKPDYRIGPGDIVEVIVLNHDEFHTKGTVTDQGILLIPIIGEYRVADMTVGELDKQLTALIGKKYLQHPEVNVAVEKYNNMQVYIVGHVQKPGLYKLTGPTTLLELISLAGDFTEGAGSTITVARAKAHEVFQGGKSKLVYEEEPIVIDVKKLLVEGDLTLNINLMNDDKIYVPGKSLSGQVFVFGEVNRPGYYSYRPDMTVFDAINTAGGFTEYAKKSGVVIKRSEGERGESTSIKVNMKALLKKGRIEKNVTLQPGDIIVVPSSFLF